MSYDTLGIRIGAANNQAATITAALITAGIVHDVDEAIVTHSNLADAFYQSAESQQNAVVAAQPQAAPVQGPPNPAYNAADALKQELGATPVVTKMVEVITTKNGGQFGPLPAWFVAEAAAKGVEKVFDNRGAIEAGTMSKRAPWFKSPKDAGDVPFWPPKNGG